MKKSIITFVLILSLGLLIYHFSFWIEDPNDIAPSVHNYSTGNQADTIPPIGFPYPTMFNFNYSGIGGMTGGMYGAIWFNGRYYFNRWNGTKVYRYFDNGPGGGPGTLSDSLDYIGDCRDLTTDGTFLYGGQANSTLYRFNPITMGVIKTFTLTGGITRGLAWDPNRKGFWNCNFLGDIFFHDTNGVLKQTIPSALTAKAGLGFDSTSSPDSAFLWVWNQGATITNELVKYHIQSGTIKATYVFSSGSSFLGSAGGAEVLINNNKLMLLLNYQNYALAGYNMKDIPIPPMYYNFNNGTSSNTYPFNITSGKAVNSLFLAGEINQPTPIPSGYSFDKVYFRTSNAGTRTYTNLHILLAQSAITTLTSGTFYPGPYDTVYQSASTTLSSTAGGWMEVTLNHQFPYDPTKSLILFVGHCGATGSGGSVYNTAGMSDIRRIWSVGGCPFTPNSAGDSYILNFGVHIIPTIINPPEYIYYKFENNPTPASTPNCAAPGVGNTIAPLSNLTLETGGQFDSCLVGTGLSNSGVTTGWNWNTGTSSWTISMWIQIPTSSSSSAYYLFGDAGLGLRCFHNGAAGQNNLVLRGNGINDVTITGIGPAPTVVTFVCQPAFTSPYVIKAYKNGVLANTVAQTTINLTAGTGLKVGGYSTYSSFIGKMDEFRLYHQALSDQEVYTSCFLDLNCCTSAGPLTLNAKAYLEGFWYGITHVSDTVKIYLANSTAPYTFVDSQSVVLSNLGTAQVIFTNASSGSYYIVLKHRNHLETWSASPKTFILGSPLSYDFTTAQSNAYGSNLIYSNGGWCIYGGDVNQDGFVDGADMAMLDNDLYNYASGYTITDLNGDQFVDGADMAILDNDLYNYIGVIKPGGKDVNKRSVRLKPERKENKTLWNIKEIKKQVDEGTKKQGDKETRKQGNKVTR